MAISRRQFLAFEGRAGAPCADHWLRVHRTAMACRFEIVLPGEKAWWLEAARAALDEADRIEAALTVFRDTSELVRLNRTADDGPVVVSEALFLLLARCRELHARTEGAFDITTTPLSRCWGFLQRQARVPPVEAIDAARELVGMDRMDLDSKARSVRFQRAGMELNLGSIGKGYALDRMGALLRARGVREALLSAGGSSVVALGGPSGGWTIDLHSRRVARGRLARLRLRDGALATSGAGEQYVEAGGRRYGHVLDPRTGWPASGVLSASVVTRDAASADALSTAFLVAGPDLAGRYCAEHADTIAILTLDDDAERPRVFGRYAGVTVEEA